MPTTNNTNIMMEMGEKSNASVICFSLEIAFTCFVRYLLWREVAFISLSSHAPGFLKRALDKADTLKVL